MANKPIKIALLGLGTVGTGVYKLLSMRADDMPQIAGAPIEISHILVRNASKPRSGVETALLTDNWNDIISDPEVSIVVELMGGIEPAHTYIKEALQANKNVVTANKDLIAVHGGELLDLAEEHHCDLQFEASVAGAIPIIHPLKQSLAGNRITEIMGIVNGTTNYILTRMTEDGMEFSEALAKATELGYAEADPTADIEGYDAGRKVAIMASIAFHSRVTFDDVFTEGITNIQARDIRYAKEMGKAVKLLGVACNTDEGIEVRVHPMLIPSSHPLATVNNAFNAVFVHGDALDDASLWAAAPVSCRLLPRSPVILSTPPATSSCTAPAALAAHATKSCRLKRWRISRANITCVLKWKTAWVCSQVSPAYSATTA